MCFIIIDLFYRDLVVPKVEGGKPVQIITNLIAIQYVVQFSNIDFI
jgi:hypothetical protein